MPSVGTLNLTVESNAGEVGKSLGALAGALERIQKAVPTSGLGLGQIASEVSSFITQINKIKSASTAFKSIEQLGNGLKGIAQTVKYSTDSIKEASEGTNKVVSSINTKPIVTAIKELKSAIGEGFKIGTAGVQLVKIKDALGGEWDTSKAKSVSAILRDIADASREVGSSNILSVATGINELSKAIEQYAEISNRYKKVSENVNDKLAEATNVGGTASGLTSFQMMIGQRAPLQIFGGRGSKHSEGQIAMDIPGLQKQTEGLVEVQSRIEKTTESIDGLKESVANMAGPVKALDLDKYLGNPIESIQSKVQLGENAIDRFGNTVGYVLPKVLDKSADAVVASKNIQMLMEKLNTPISWKGLDGVVNQLNGIGREMLSAKSAGEFFAKIPIEELAEILKPYRQENAGEMKRHLNEIINTVRDELDIPALLDTSGFGSRRGPYNCKKCNKDLKHIIIDNNLSQTKIEYDCECKNEWLAEINNSNMNSSTVPVKHIPLY